MKVSATIQRHLKMFFAVLASVLVSCCLSMALSTEDAFADSEINMYRVYNPNSGEHFYTNNAGEKDALVSIGWKDEGVAWTAPETSDTPVYRMYNPNTGDHHYTINAGERDALTAAGWNYEGIGWYSDDSQRTPLYRLYNPNAAVGSHHYTTNAGERDILIAAGWKDEGTGWHGIGAGSAISAPPAEQPSGPNISDTVYIAKSGECFHRQTCPTLKKSKSIAPTTVKQAKAKGLRACKDCRPLG